MMFTHGHTGSPTYRAWQYMKTRCLNKNYHAHKKYKALGFDSAWIKFEVFLKDMGEKPYGKSLDRINNNIGYSPNNCRWATLQEQNNNKSSNHWIEYDGKKLTMAQWARKLHISYDALSNRIVRDKWSIHKAFTKPTRDWPLKKSYDSSSN